MKRSSREAVLGRIRANQPPEVHLPDLPASGPWQTFEDLRARFSEMLQFVGGTAVFVETVAQAHADLQQRPAWSTAKVRYSVVSGVGDSTPGIDVITDPHQLENVDFAVLRGHLAVAENAAVWVTDETVRHRVLYFLPQHLALVVPARALVHNLHEAYHRLTIGDRPFGAFVSGPSKTADIEQSLVIGAHGARSLVVYLVEDLPEA